MRSMTAAARAQPEDFFTSDQWRDLSARSSWRGLWLVAHCWLMMGAAIAMGIAWPATIPLAVVLVGNRQLGLFILMHDAAHALLHSNRAVNDWVGKWFCGTELNAYRPYHLQHHRFVQQAEDPDLVLSAPFPITRDSLWRKMVRDLTGQTFFKQRFGRVVGKLKSRGDGDSVWPIFVAEFQQQRFFYIFNATGLVLFSLAGLGWAWWLMWLLPMATWLPLISRLRNISEHALVAQNEPDPLRHARTTQASWLERLLIAPYWVNYHCEHHMFTQVACWNLPAAHRILDGQGATVRMALQPGYLSLLRAASAAPTRAGA
jgi:fatty acid desaturase